MAAFYKQTVTIAINASLSGAAVYRGLEWGLCAIVMPSAWTAASITFQGSHDGGTTFNNMYNTSGTELSVSSAAASANNYIALDPKDFVSVSGLKLRSGTSGTPVNQAAARTITLVFRRFA